VYGHFQDGRACPTRPNCPAVVTSTRVTRLMNPSRTGVTSFRQNPALPFPPTTTTMASTVLRSLARAKPAAAGRLASRSFMRSARACQEQTTKPLEEAKKTGFDYHTVEDLQGMTAHDILTGPTDDTKMRHFTGTNLFEISCVLANFCSSQLRVRSSTNRIAGICN